VSQKNILPLILIELYALLNNKAGETVPGDPHLGNFKEHIDVARKRQAESDRFTYTARTHGKKRETDYRRSGRRSQRSRCILQVD